MWSPVSMRLSLSIKAKVIPRFSLWGTGNAVVLQKKKKRSLFISQIFILCHREGAVPPILSSRGLESPWRSTVSQYAKRQVVRVFRGTTDCRVSSFSLSSQPLSCAHLHFLPLNVIGMVESVVILCRKIGGSRELRGFHNEHFKFSCIS